MAKISKITEHWLPVKGYEGMYEVSDTGRVRSLDRYVEYEHYGGVSISKKKGRELTAIVGKSNPYAYVTLCKNGIHKRIRLHRIVAEAFVPNPNNYPVVNHKDEKHTNNRADNLEWCTTLYNCNYGTKKQRGIQTRKEKYPKGTENARIEKFRATMKDRKRACAERPIYLCDNKGNIIKEYRSAAEAGKELGLWPQNIRSVLYGRYQRTGGYYFKRAD